MAKELMQFVEGNAWSNEVVLGALLPKGWWVPLPHTCRTWLRIYTAGTIVYLMTGILWCTSIYYSRYCGRIPKEAVPSIRSMLMHIKISMQSLPFYSGLPTLIEYVVEKGWTKCYAKLEEVSWATYIGNTIAYLMIIEFGIYWMHRWLHTVKPLYTHLHASHHIYSSPDTISPFAGLAFHPLDGLMQAFPHLPALFLVPMHFPTHLALFFFEALWTANIHDNIHGRVWPIMGAGYHGLHHTTHRNCNYGHYTVCMDWLFGTLHTPPADTDKIKGLSE
nr:PREDICTED: delta(7)-sterol-C5(6)-desaturase-like isoform X1 [Bemisia tabaci]